MHFKTAVKVYCMVHTTTYSHVLAENNTYFWKVANPCFLDSINLLPAPHHGTLWHHLRTKKLTKSCCPFPVCSFCSQSHQTNLDKRMIEKLAGRPPHLWVTFQAVAKEVFPFGAHFVRNRRFMTHPHFIHDLEVVLIFMPRPLQRVTALLSASFSE